VPDAPPAAPLIRRHARTARLLLGVGLALAVGVSVWSMDRVPGASWQPALLGLVPWIVGKYVLCPLRWHSLSASGQSRRWHMRAYAESELIGLASPAHVGADLWRMHRLQGNGMTRPRPRVLAKGVLISMGYQITIMGLLIGNVAAMGEQVNPLALLGVFGASQVAGIIPGVHGASPREGALVVGLASLGVTWTAALGAVALTAGLAWLPALLLGGACLGARRLRIARAA
jgi:hypothetical protein